MSLCPLLQIKLPADLPCISNHRRREIQKPNKKEKRMHKTY